MATEMTTGTAASWLGGEHGPYNPPSFWYCFVCTQVAPTLAKISTTAKTIIERNEDFLATSGSEGRKGGRRRERERAVFIAVAGESGGGEWQA